MDVYEAIVNKRDTRDFTDDPVSDDDLQKVLQAGRMAGSAKNQQLNRIVVVTDAGDRAKLAECGKFADWVPSGVGIGHPAPAREKRESSPRIPLEELVDWGRWEA